MLSASSSPIIFWNRPYFDLGPSNGGPLHLYGLELSWRALDDERMPQYGLQVHLPASFRESLCHETGMAHYHVEDPLHLPDELHTARWQKLCDYLTRYRGLTPTTQLRVINVLRSLSMHRAVLTYVPEMAAQEIARNPVSAALSLRRAMSTLVLHLEAGLPYNREDFERIGCTAPSGSLAKLSAALQLVAQDAKLHQDASTIAYWAEVAATEIQHITEPLDNFGAELLLSIYQRAVAFLPFLRGDRHELVEAMERCEAHARHLPCQNADQQLIACENLNIILQSRTKEALWLGNLDLAEARAQQLVERDPFDSLYQLELGDVLVRRGKIAEAAHAYHAAVCLGPPRTAVAWFWAGQCHQEMGELATACTCYLDCLRVDPLAISALQQLAHIAPRLGHPGIQQWSQRRLAELQEQTDRSEARTGP